MNVTASNHNSFAVKIKLPNISDKIIKIKLPDYKSRKFNTFNDIFHEITQGKINCGYTNESNYYQYDNNPQGCRDSEQTDILLIHYPDFLKIETDNRHEHILNTFIIKNLANIVIEYLYNKDLKFEFNNDLVIKVSPSNLNKFIIPILGLSATCIKLRYESERKLIFTNIFVNNTIRDFYHRHIIEITVENKETYLVGCGIITKVKEY